MIMSDAGKTAKVRHVRELGMADGRQFADFFHRHCIDAVGDARMLPSMWLRVHYEDIIPARLAKLKVSGFRDKQLGIYKDAADWMLGNRLGHWREDGSLDLSDDPAAAEMLRQRSPAKGLRP